MKVESAKASSPVPGMIYFSDLSERLRIADLPPIDSMDPDGEHVTSAQRMWITTGVAMFPGVLDHGLIDAYCRLRESFSDARTNDDGGSCIDCGWTDPTPYMRHKEIRDLGCSEAVYSAIREIMGAEPYGMHLNLTGWVSTERNWHQDDYLNNQGVSCNYVAAWLALDDIHPDSGPFEYVPGSHRWPVIRQSRMRAVFGDVIMSNPRWPKLTEETVARACELEIEERDAVVLRYLPKRGDLLLWHGALMHRGSIPRVPGMLRKSLIIHYSSLSHRPDMPVRQECGSGHIFVLNGKVQ